MRSIDSAVFQEWFTNFALNGTFVPVGPANRRYRLRHLYGLTEPCQGIAEALAQYQWRGVGWEETLAEMNQNSQQLQDAVQAGDGAQALQSCHKIIYWGGGNRALGNGGMQLLQHKAQQGSLTKYLSECAVALALENPNENFGCVKRMDSMLTKVHSLAADDGLPIYDSRVAGTMSVAFHAYQNAEGVDEPNPYQPLDRSRRSNNHPAILTRTTRSKAAWCRAAVCLGRLLKSVLNANPELFGQYDSIADRMHAFDAALFVVGYDPEQIALAN